MPPQKNPKPRTAWKSLGAKARDAGTLSKQRSDAWITASTLQWSEYLLAHAEARLGRLGRASSTVGPISCAIVAEQFQVVGTRIPMDEQGGR